MTKAAKQSRTKPRRRAIRIAAWSVAWVAFALVVVMATVRECSTNGCGVADATAFAGLAALLVLVCAVLAVAVGAMAWAFASAVVRVFKGRGSREDYYIAAFVFFSLAVAAALLASLSRDAPIGFADVGSAGIVGVVAVTVVWGLGGAVVRVFRGTASRADYRAAVFVGFVLLVAAALAVWSFVYLTQD